MVNYRKLVENYLRSWGNDDVAVDYYLSLPDWEEYFSFLLSGLNEEEDY